MRTCPIAAENTEDNLLRKNDFLSFQGYILQVRWTKAKFYMSNFFRILSTKIIHTSSFLTELFKK